MSQLYKICPICSAPNHRKATICSTCGTTIAGVITDAPDSQDKPTQIDYNPSYGETDLLEGRVPWKGGTYLLSGLAVLFALTCLAITLTFGTGLLSNPANGIGVQNVRTITPIQTADTGALPIITNTPRPTILLSTVTQGPPTAPPTDTPPPSSTQGPCVQQVQPNDDLISIIYRCGHRTFDTIIDAVVELNDLDDPSRIQAGQEIQVPWPTSTLDPNITPSATIAGEAAALSVAAAEGETVLGVRLVPTATLLPGVIWHSVRKDENILLIAYQYASSLRTLSELNPEIAFSQCDFGLGSGGPNCVVQLYEGQQLRVPQPTPTPTIPPTASGSETPTPTSTPTFNAPTALSPSDRAYFGKDAIITLRWVATGSLGAEQAYLIRVEDRATTTIYTATTGELSFIVPEAWQGQDDQRHDYVWTVGVIDADKPDNPYFTTAPRLFTWQGRGG